MKILFVASAPHLEEHGGAGTYTRAILSLFRAIDGAKVQYLVLPLPWSFMPGAFRRARAMAIGLASGSPSKSRYFLNGKARRLFEERLASEQFDVLVINSVDLLPLCKPGDERGARVVISHNVESEIIRRQIARLRLPAVLRRVIAKDIEATRRAEIAFARRCDLIVTISQLDAQWYRKHVPHVPITTIPVAFTRPPYSGPRPVVARPLRTAFVGDLGWWPNRDGVNWLADTVMSQLDASTVRVDLYGSGTEAFGKNWPNVNGHGFVESLDAVWASAHFTLCPILSGSGINVKLVESLYNGVPVLATPHAVRGLPNIEDPGLAVVPEDEWPEFLCSERAQQLAGARVHQETRDLFSATAHVKRLDRELNRTVFRPSEIDN